jgi:hypothetical protein
LHTCRRFITSGTSPDLSQSSKPNAFPAWIDPHGWNLMTSLMCVPSMEAFIPLFMKHGEEFRHMCFSDAPLTHALPPALQASVTPMQVRSITDVISAQTSMLAVPQQILHAFAIFFKKFIC